MYRRFVITDESDEKIVFNCYPDHKQPNLMEFSKDEIAIGHKTREYMLAMVDVVSKFMSGNTINKLVVEEMEE